VDKDALCNLLGQDFNSTHLLRVDRYPECDRCRVALPGHLIGPRLDDEADWHGSVA
jgi:hypothetical protein